MRLLGVILLTVLAGSVLAQTKAEKRLTGLETRVTKVEKRVSILETGSVPAQLSASSAPVRDVRPAAPIAALFLKKKQVVTKKQMGVRLYFQLENVSSRKYFAFNGTLVFRGPKRKVIWSKEYAYSEVINPFEKLKLTLFISSNNAKEYLNLVKTRDITLSFEDQQAYGAN